MLQYIARNKIGIIYNGMDAGTPLPTGDLNTSWCSWMITNFAACDLTPWNNQAYSMANWNSNPNANVVMYDMQRCLYTANNDTTYLTEHVSSGTATLVNDLETHYS